MSKPTLYYALFSPPARACMITAKLIGLDINLHFVDFSKKEHLSEEFVRLNPQHTIPVLIDEGEPIWDSHAIMAYMVSKYAKDDSLYPKDLLTRARVDQRLHFENGVLFQVIKDFVNRIIYGGEPEFNAITLKLCHIGYEFLEKFLENDYVVGNHLTIGDVSIQTTVITLRRLVPIAKEKYPRITTWLGRMEALPDNEEVNEKGAEQLAARILSFLSDKKAN